MLLLLHFGFIIGFAVAICLYIWAIIVAKNARREIQNGEGAGNTQGIVYNQSPLQLQVISSTSSQPPQGMQMVSPQGTQMAPPQGMQMAWNGKEWVPVTYQA